MAANLAEVSIPMPPNPADRAQAALEAAQARQIVTAQDYAVVADELKAVKAKWNEIEAERDKLQKPIRAAAAAIQAFFTPPLNFLKQAEGILKGKLQTWDDEQEAKRRAEQARLDEIARQERLKREAEAREAQRIANEKAAAARREAEEKRQAEGKARREAAEAKARGDAEAAAAAARVAQEAARAAAKLDTKAASITEKGEQKAADIQQSAATVVAPVLQTTIPKVSGLTTRDNWRAEVTDLHALVKAVAAGQAPLSLVMANDKVLGQQARSLKEHFVAPGVRVWNDKTKAAASV